MQISNFTPTWIAGKAHYCPAIFTGGLVTRRCKPCTARVPRQGPWGRASWRGGWRFASNCAAMLAAGSCRRTPVVRLRSLWSNSCGKPVHEARYARRPHCCASRRPTSRPHPKSPATRQVAWLRSSEAQLRCMPKPPHRCACIAPLPLWGEGWGEGHARQPGHPQSGVWA